MGSEIESVTLIDSNGLANDVMHDIKDVVHMESSLSMELTSEELFRIDCAILASLRNTRDFSRDLLKKLESGSFKEVAEKPPKTPTKVLEAVQQEAILDLTAPIHDMFSQMEDFVVEAFA